MHVGVGRAPAALSHNRQLEARPQRKATARHLSTTFALERAPGMWAAVDERLLPGFRRCPHIAHLPGKPHGDEGLHSWAIAVDGVIIMFHVAEGGESDGPTSYEDVLVHMSSGLRGSADSRFSTLGGATRNEAARRAFASRPHAHACAPCPVRSRPPCPQNAFPPAPAHPARAQKAGGAWANAPLHPRCQTVQCARQPAPIKGAGSAERRRVPVS